jgi:hypothetical protein
VLPLMCFRFLETEINRLQTQLMQCPPYEQVRRSLYSRCCILRHWAHLSGVIDRCPLLVHWGVRMWSRTSVAS